MEPFFKGFWVFLLIFSRILGIFMLIPVFSSENVPYRFRVSFAFFLSILFFPLVREYLPKTSFENFYYYLLELFSQFSIGLLISFFIQLVFSAFILAGEFFSIQMGISFSEVLDPQSQISLPLVGTLKNLIAIILFLTVDFQMDGFYVPAYLHVIRALHFSFIQLPTLQFDFNTIQSFINYIDDAFAFMFLVALKIGLPLIGILFITSVTLGIAGKASPQLNLLNMGLQINIITGIIVLVILFPVIIPIMRDSFHNILDLLGEMFYGWNKR